MCHSMLHTDCAIFIPPCQWLKLLWCNPALWKGFCRSTPQLSAPSHINLSLIAGRCCPRCSGRQSCALRAANATFNAFCFERCLLWIGMSCLGRSSRSLWARRTSVQARRYRGMFPVHPCFVPACQLCSQHHLQLCSCWDSEPQIFPFLLFLSFSLQNICKDWLKCFFLNNYITW